MEAQKPFLFRTKLGAVRRRKPCCVLYVVPTATATPPSSYAHYPLCFSRKKRRGKWGTERAASQKCTQELIWEGRSFSPLASA